jgi:uncharacterized protein (TIGR02246 family)
MENIKKLIVISSIFASLAIFGLLGPRARADDQSVVRMWLNGWNSHDVDTFVAMFTEDAVFEHVPLNSVSRGTDQIRAFAEFYFTALPTSSSQS